jgi:hypothetical protein
MAWGSIRNPLPAPPRRRMPGDNAGPGESIDAGCDRSLTELTIA